MLLLLLLFCVVNLIVRNIAIHDVIDILVVRAIVMVMPTSIVILIAIHISVAMLVL